jgi:ribosomal protein S1
MPYGAFVDIGTTTDGLVHVSQLADEFVSDISTIVKVGDEVQVRIVSIETEINKISLSMRSESAERKPRAAREGGDSRAPGAGGDKKRSNSKELPEEFKNFDQQKVMKGKVVSVLDYGCFVALNDQVEALVHVSEMSDDRNVKPEAFVKVGEEVSCALHASFCFYANGHSLGRANSEIHVRYIPDGCPSLTLWRVGRWTFASSTTTS